MEKFEAKHIHAFVGMILVLILYRSTTLNYFLFCIGMLEAPVNSTENQMIRVQYEASSHIQTYLNALYTEK